MSSLDAMFEASSVYFQCVNERAVHVKKTETVFPVGVDLGRSKSLISIFVRWFFRLLGFYE